jgi:hypothetical protein
VSDLTDFLLARIAEDEKVARAAWRPWDSVADQEDCFGRLSEESWEFVNRFEPARALADCEAMKAIVSVASDRYFIDAAAGDFILRHLAEPYRDHPDYPSRVETEEQP